MNTHMGTNKGMGSWGVSEILGKDSSMDTMRNLNNHFHVWYWDRLKILNQMRQELLVCQ